MSDNILNISNWKQDYPFLDSVWNTYMKFDKPVLNTDTNNTVYDNACHQIISHLNGDVKNHKTYCMKLIRNLGHYYTDTNYFDPTYERCNILYNWLYNSSKSEKNIDNMIEKCFIDYNDQMEGKRKILKCSYDSYKNMYLDKMKLNILNLFHYNAEVLRKTLMDADDSNKTRCREFVCKCLKIYKPMNEKYCIKQKETRQKHEKICLELDQFNSTYKIFYNKLLHINPKIPSLDDINNDDFPSCQSYEPKQKSQSVSEVDTADGRVQGARVRLKPQSEGTSNVAEQSDNGTSLNTSTVLSSMVGIPPFLALIYKFTPVGSMFRSKNNRSMNIFNNIDDEIEKELTYPSHKNAIINSRVSTYNVAYGSV